jgi:hypothetical protein
LIVKVRVVEARLAAHGADEGRDDVGDQRRHDGAEGGADDHGDGEVHQVAAQDERAELLEHAPSPGSGTRDPRSDGGRLTRGYQACAVPQFGQLTDAVTSAWNTDPHAHW